MDSILGKYTIMECWIELELFQNRVFLGGGGHELNAPIPNLPIPNLTFYALYLIF